MSGIESGCDEPRPPCRHSSLPSQATSFAASTPYDHCNRLWLISSAASWLLGATLPSCWSRLRSPTAATLTSAASHHHSHSTASFGTAATSQCLSQGTTTPHLLAPLPSAAPSLVTNQITSAYTHCQSSLAPRHRRIHAARRCSTASLNCRCRPSSLSPTRPRHHHPCPGAVLAALDASFSKSPCPLTPLLVLAAADPVMPLEATSRLLAKRHSLLLVISSSPAPFQRAPSSQHAIKDEQHRLRPGRECQLLRPCSLSILLRCDDLHG